MAERAVHLLDVNVLVAIFDGGHTHHAAAHRWLAAHTSGAWASCAITENGFIRLAANAVGMQISAAQAADHLREFQRNTLHEFWASEVSLTDSSLFELALANSGKHSTDIYLAGLAHTHGGRFVTFDQRVPWRAVRGATADLIEILRND